MSAGNATPGAEEELPAFAQELRDHFAEFDCVDVAEFDQFDSVTDFRLRVHLGDDHPATPRNLHEVAARYQLDLVVEDFDSRQLLLLPRAGFHDSFQCNLTVGEMP